MTETHKDADPEQHGDEVPTPETDAARTDAARTDAAQTESAETDAAQTDAAETDAAQTDAEAVAASFAPPAPHATVYEPGQAPHAYAPPAAAAPAPPAYTQPTTPIPPAFGQSAAHTQPTTPLAVGGETPAEKRSRSWPLLAGVGLVAALVGGISGAGVTALITANQGSAAPASETQPQSISINDADDVNRISAVAASATPSVVTISVSGEQSGGTGSGVIISEDGYVITNTHVVTLDGSTASPAISVKTSDGQLHSATLIGTDPYSDLAVIQIDGASGLPALDFADSSKLNVGDTAIAIGAPLGLSSTVTNGIVSALNRSITVASSAVPEAPESDQPQQQPENPFDFWNFPDDGQGGQGGPGAPSPQARGTISLAVIQTDAAINPGNSGGALLDGNGRLIGINVAILSTAASQAEAGSIGVGFAVPANLAQRVAQEIIENGKATHGLLGAEVAPATLDSDSTTVGATVKRLTPGGAAEKGGLRVGDVITVFNGVPITDADDMVAQVRAMPAGAETELSYVRDGERGTATVTLGTLE